MANNHAGRTVAALPFVAQLDRSSEFPIEGRRFRVTTRTGSVYLIDDVARTITRNDGPPQAGFVQGATFGGSMLMSGRLLADAYMEYVLTDEPRVVRTSLVTGIEPV